MQKLLISHERFKGHIITIYGEEKELLTIDYTEAMLSVAQRKYFTERMPPVLDEDFVKAFTNSKGECSVIIITDDLQLTFEMFWERYGHKINRIRCEKWWERMSKIDRVKAYYGIGPYFRYLESLPYDRKKMDPENYLKNKAWNNEWK